jgi:hypothetical protein
MQIPYGVFIALVIGVCVWLNRIAPPNTRTLLMALVTLPTVAGFASKYHQHYAFIASVSRHFIVFSDGMDSA